MYSFEIVDSVNVAYIVTIDFNKQRSISLVLTLQYIQQLQKCTHILVRLRTPVCVRSMIYRVVRYFINQ